jgi:hypothetical protein
MSEPDELAEKLLPLYRNEIRALLADHKAPGLEAVDRLAELLEGAKARKPRLDFGFVGESQVGKSTLINALIGQATLPAGGVGPLTAQATEVAYADENAIWVRYHTRQKLNQLAFALERYLVARGDISSAGARIVTESDPLDEDLDLVEGAVEGSKKSEKGEYFLQQAQLMLTGSGTAPALTGAVLLDGLRAVLGQALRGEVATKLAPHQARIEMLRTKCNTTEELKESEVGGASAFRKELRLRAAGALAPLVAELKVKLDKPFLRYATLVDLPGVGVVGDPAARVAEEFVRTRGDALIVVTRNSGLSTPVADLLERTGVITKLLFGDLHGEPAIRVLVAVTHLDSVASNRYTEAVQVAGESGDPLPDRHKIFEDLAVEMRARIRAQVETALRESSSFEDLPVEHKARRDEVVTKLCGGLDVLIVAANDFLNLSVGGQQDLAFLKTIESTGIPDFRRHVQDLSVRLAKRRTEIISTAAKELNETLEDHLEMLAGLYDEGGGRASAEWERFRVELGATLAPLREQMKAHHGEILGTLKSTLPTKIEILCKDAEKIATLKLHRLRRRGEADVHWKSLEAALRRGGVYDRREINYPDAITRAFVDSVASDWEPTVVEGIRRTMRSLADRDVGLVEQVCAFATAFDERIVGEAHIDTQKKLLLQQAHACLSWTRERLEQLRDDVQQKLIDEVRAPIEKAAAAALNAGKNRGVGAKGRILDAFEEGGEKAIERASAKALTMLTGYYNKLCLELEKNYLAEHHDPLQAAEDALTKDELLRARRSDSQRKRRVLEQVAAHQAALRALK